MARIHGNTVKAVNLRAMKRHIAGETDHLAGYVSEVERLELAHHAAQEHRFGRVVNTGWASDWAEWAEAYSGDTGDYPYGLY